MKSPTRTPPKTGQNDKIVIDAEPYTGADPETIELICNECHKSPLVKIRSTSGEDTELFCKFCSITYSMDDESVRHKTTLSFPEETEPAITSVGVTPDVSIRHEVEMRGSFKELAKRGTIRFTSYHTTERQ